ncbi:arginase family protein [Micromonospora sp. MS34]|uniref:arginase family protein n=1 Tax=Micromonospora sp. MS34 TaxID=3385971 RepID=UPI00399F3181
MTGFTVVEVPQWQGSGSATARRLRRGAAALAALIPADERVRIEVGDEPGTAGDGVGALGVLVRNLHAVRAAQADVGGRTMVTVGGDCGVGLAPVEAALARFGAGLAVVWLDAHGGLNTPASSPSGAVHGMVLRALLGDGPRDLTPTRTLRPAQVVLAGVRALDPGERAFIEGNAIAHLDTPRLVEPSALVDAVAATGAHAVYLHIDLDRLDRRLFASVGTGEPGGLTPDQLTVAVHALAARFTVAGLGITKYEPGRPADRDLPADLVDAFVPVIRPARSAGPPDVSRGRGPTVTGPV